jgi:hypothetical protein
MTSQPEFGYGDSLGIGNWKNKNLNPDGPTVTMELIPSQEQRYVWQQLFMTFPLISPKSGHLSGHRAVA